MTRNGDPTMTIGRLADAVGVPATTLRYYEREGLLSPTARNRAGYRFYDESALRRLEFIRSAQTVGFTLDDIRSLLELNGATPCRDVQNMIQRRLTEIDAKLAELSRVRGTLSDALQRCHRSKRGCPVIDDLRKPRRVRRSQP